MSWAWLNPLSPQEDLWKPKSRGAMFVTIEEANELINIVFDNRNSETRTTKVQEWLQELVDSQNPNDDD